MAISEPVGSSDNIGPQKGFDVNRLPVVGATQEETEDGITISSPNSTLSSFHMDFCVRSSNSGGRNSNKRDHNIMEGETERTSSRASDDEENGSTRKKLRLSKEQSAFLEESFKEHSTLNPVSQSTFICLFINFLSSPKTKKDFILTRNFIVI